jgi:hypothetical protein
MPSGFWRLQTVASLRPQSRTYDLHTRAPCVLALLDFRRQEARQHSLKEH